MKYSNNTRQVPASIFHGFTNYIVNKIPKNIHFLQCLQVLLLLKDNKKTTSKALLTWSSYDH